MSIELKVPSAGESITEVIVAEWLKPEGAHANRDEPVALIETDKANVEIVAPVGGTLARILKKAGEQARVGEVIALFEPGEGAVRGDGGGETPVRASRREPSRAEAPASEASTEPARAAAAPAAAAPTATAAPATAAPATAAPTVTAAPVTAAPATAAPTATATPATATPATAAPATAAPTATAAPASATPATAAPAIGARAAAPSSRFEPPAPPPRTPSGTHLPPTEPRISPSKRRAIREAEQRGDDIGIAQAQPSPPSITAVVPTSASSTVVAGEPRIEARPEARAPKNGRNENVVPMSPLRRRVAERLVHAQQTAAMLTTFNEADMSEVMALRKQHQDAFKEKHGVKLGFMSFFVKAAIEALRDFPAINAEIRDQDIIYHHYYDIGVAIGGGKGLVVPIIRNAHEKTFAEIEKLIADFGERAKQSRLKVEELQGGTFTISNGGVYGSMMSTPILNPPQSGILGMHAIQDRAVVRNGALAVAPMMYLALTYDHRIVDGREAVSFLVRVKECIEKPARMLLEV